MILTGRAVAAREAFDWGMANRLCEDGEALATAQAMAAEIARFPALCMRADRATSYEQFGLPLQDALRLEARRGEAPIRDGARDGAARFAAGKGRGGDFGSI